MLSILINVKIMNWYTMYIFFVDLGVVVACVLLCNMFVHFVSNV